MQGLINFLNDNIGVKTIVALNKHSKFIDFFNNLDNKD